MEKLLPCPFCGSQAFIEEHDPVYQDPFPYRIICMNTDCLGAHVWEETEEDAIKGWNTRADGWISVEDRLPDDLQLCTVYDKDGRYDQLRFYDEKEFVEEWGITHWMPLPSPPEVTK
jgi:Lar family restriction alleviation protein